MPRTAHNSHASCQQVEGAPVSAVSLGSTTGGGTRRTKAEEFKLALEALGEGWLAGKPNGKAPGEKAKPGTARISAEIPCYLQVLWG